MTAPDLPGTAPPLHVLSAGAARGLVTALEPSFAAAHGVRFVAGFGAVGTIRDQLLAGSPCDVLILTEALLRDLAADGWIDGASIRPIGRVATGIAMRAGDPPAPAGALADADGLRRLLAGADALYTPDTRQSTAGRHFLALLERLGLRDTLAPRLREHPNGAIAMAEMARGGDAAPLGCTQVTEILYTPGVSLLGRLPEPHGLETPYAIARATAKGGARDAVAGVADAFVATASGPASRALRTGGGFDA